MNILTTTNLIHIAVSEDELNIIQQALRQYRGPFAPGVGKNLDDEAQETKALIKASYMATVIEDELMERFNKEQL